MTGRLLWCLLFVLGFGGTAPAEDSRGSFEVWVTVPGVFGLRYQSHTLDAGERVRVLPPEAGPCGMVVHKGVIYEIFSLECGRLLAPRWAREQGDADGWFLPLVPRLEEGVVQPPADSTDAARRPSVPGGSGSITFDPFLDRVTVTMPLDPAHAVRMEPIPDGRRTVEEHLLGAVPRARAAGGLAGTEDPDPMLLVVHGPAEDVVEHLVRRRHLVSAAFTTFESGTRYRLVPDLDRHDTWHVLIDDRLILRSFTLEEAVGP